MVRKQICPYTIEILRLKIILTIIWMYQSWKLPNLYIQLWKFKTHISSDVLKIFIGNLHLNIRGTQASQVPNRSLNLYCPPNGLFTQSSPILLCSLLSGLTHGCHMWLSLSFILTSNPVHQPVCQPTFHTQWT